MIMSRIRGLELLFNLAKNQLKSKEDCLVAAIHCLLINENLHCVGIGETFSNADAQSASELLPKGWNDNQEVYTLRYTSRDFTNRFLIKIVKTGHIMHVNAVLNEDNTAAMSLNVDKYINDYNDYITTYQELDGLSATLHSEILDKIQESPSKTAASKPSKQLPPETESPRIPIHPRPMPVFDDHPNYEPMPFPRLGGRPFPSVGGSDLDPLGRGQGGMILDPSSFGIPSRPHMPPFGPHPGLPRGAVPPGARFDPFGPPIRGPNRYDPSPDHYNPPDYDDII